METSKKQRILFIFVSFPRTLFWVKIYLTFAYDKEINVNHELFVYSKRDNPSITSITAEDNFDFSAWNTFGIEKFEKLKKFSYNMFDNIYYTYMNIEEPQNEGGSDLANLTFVITGSVSEFKNRNELKQVIESAGGKVTGSVSKNTNYLINNDTESTTSKNMTAKKLGIPIISEKEFLKLFGFLKK